jgi:DivIVA domain-containing protein
MPVLPEEITHATFRRRLWRGYQPSDVAAFLGRVASDYAGAIESVAREATRTPEQLTQAREQADAETAGARERAQHTAESIIRQAEQSAHALTGEIEALRAQARVDADAARARLEEADTRARQLEDVARQRWDAPRADTEHRWQRVVAADRRLDDRVRQLERALAALRSRAALLDQLTEVEDLMATIRTESRPDWKHPDQADANGQA